VFFDGMVLFAQASVPDVTFTPIVNFTGIFETLFSVIGAPVAAVLSLGLAIWGARYMFFLIKSMGEDSDRRTINSDYDRDKYRRRLRASRYDGMTQEEKAIEKSIDRHHHKEYYREFRRT